jgi:VanZ family protein
MTLQNSKLPPQTPPTKRGAAAGTRGGVPKKLATWLWHWLPPLMVMAVIFYFSSRTSLPQAAGEWIDALLKKLSHVAEYTLLFLLLVRAWNWTLDSSEGQGRNMGSALWAALVTTALYGISDEVHQAFVPRRHAKLSDVLIDVLVPLLLCLLWYWWRGRLRARNPDLAE